MDLDNTAQQGRATPPYFLYCTGPARVPASFYMGHASTCDKRQTPFHATYKGLGIFKDSTFSFSFKDKFLAKNDD